MCHPHPLRSPEEWESAVSFLFEQKKAGTLRIISGSLVWSDVIECTLECTNCAELFEVFVETYHGSGGSWGPAARLG